MTNIVTSNYYRKDENVPELIVCACCIFKVKDKEQYYRIIGVRHFDMEMYSQIQVLEEALNIELVSYKPGFITNKGRFVDRKEALAIAKANNQIVRDIGYESDELYSEMLY